MDDKLYYLCAPYSHDDPKVIEHRMEIFCKVDAKLIARGYHTISPLAKHFVLKYENLPGDWKYWNEYSKKLLTICDAMIIICIDGWKDSIGIAGEILLAKAFRMEIIYVDEQGDIIELDI